MTPAKARLGCLHMHHSNIPYIDGIVDAERVELHHFVNPGLMRRIGHDLDCDSVQAERQVRRQLEWMASCGLDAILITCTNYIAMLPDEPLPLSIPVIKIDEPLFEYLLRQPEPHLLVFTNPATVDGTLRRLCDFAIRAGKEPHVDVEIITGTFELVMAGKTEEYATVVSARLRELGAPSLYPAISVAQLSMADSAQQVAVETGVPIGNPLQPLREFLVETLDV